MANKAFLPTEQHALRTRAVMQLGRTGPGTEPHARMPKALVVLHDLASSPATAVQALALLHELQVHQVELEIQDEELRRMRTELEASLVRHVQLYDAAPVGYMTLDADTTLHELNRRAATLLGQARDYLLGRTLESQLVPGSRGTLRSLLDGLSWKGVTTTRGTLQIALPFGAPHQVHATAARDPDGHRFLLVLLETDPSPSPSGIAHQL